jgi:ribosomal protein S18 acetylase RimI-like enzyme
MQRNVVMNQPDLQFRKAVAADADRIADLVNSGYRGDASRAGWTTEADYLVGMRTDAQELRELIAGGDSAILLCVQAGELVGSVHLQRTGDSAYLGMFVVKPMLQGQGIGKRFMQAAEEFVAREWRSKCVQMTVITLRHELIAYYERRGYRRTGEFKPFPVEDRRSSLLVDNLQFEVLEKNLELSERP